MKRAWVVDYVIKQADGDFKRGTGTVVSVDIFGAAEKAKDMIEDYKLHNPEDEARVWSIDLVAEYEPEEIFEEE